MLIAYEPSLESCGGQSELTGCVEQPVAGHVDKSVCSLGLQLGFQFCFVTLKLSKTGQADNPC